MSQKRQQQQEDSKSRPEGNSSFEDKRRKLPTFKSVVAEVLTLRKMQHIMEPVLEPLIRKVVKEEVDLALRKYLIRRNSGVDIHPSRSKSLQLQFLNAISLPVFTGTRIEGEDCSNLQVALVDALSGQIVSSGPECSAKVQIVVLEGDFDGDEKSWTLEDFRNNMVREREGKKPLITGDSFLILKDGIGVVGDISFTDNSSWTRSRKFRLGATIVDHSEGIRIREAKTEPFIVRDHRGELYKKHYPPLLSDEVWRLEKIGKDGAFHKRLSKEKVLTVKDFLQLFFLDPARLRTILGGGMSTKMWEATVGHAKTCVVDKKSYLYYPSGSPEKKGVVFNIVGEVLGCLSDSQHVSSDKLSEAEKADACRMVICAFKHWNEVLTIDDETFQGDASPFLSGAKSLANPSIQKTGRSDHAESSISSHDIVPSMFSPGLLAGFDDYSLHNMGTIDARFDQSLSFPSHVAGNSILCDTDTMTRAFCEDEHMQFLDPGHFDASTLGSPNDLHSVVSSFLIPPAPLVKAHRRWKMLFGVLSWCFSSKKQ